MPRCGIDVIFRGEGGGSPAGGIEAVKLSAFRVVHDRKQVAADPIVHRSDEAHHGVRRYGGVDRIAAALEYSSADFGGEYALAGDYPTGRSNRGPRL